MPENPKIIKELPKGDYSTKVIKELPKGEYTSAPDTKSSGTDYSFLNGIKDEATTDEIINRLDTKNEDEKQIIKNIAIAQKQGRASTEDLSDAILTIQGQHPKQNGGTKYYMKDVNGVQKPVPISNNERPPKGYDVASVWGSQESANDDGVLTSLGKHVYNGFLKGVEGVETLIDLPYAIATGEEADWYKSAKNRIESASFKTPEYEKTGEIFDTKDLKGASDFFDPSRYNLTKDNLQGAVFGGIESVTSFITSAAATGGIGKLAGAFGEGAGLIAEGGKSASFLSGATNASKIAKASTASYMVNYDEALQAGKDAGLTGQDLYAFASVATIPTAAIELLSGNEGLFVKNSLARDGKAKMFQSLAKGSKKEANGTFTKKSLEELSDVTTAAATKLNKTFAGELAGNIAGEAGTEAGQAFALNASKNIYDKISGEDKFKTDPLSLDSWGEYVNNALAGALGAGGPAVAGVSQKRNIDRAEKQSNNAYDIVKKGPEAITAMKADVDNSVANGDLTPLEGEAAKFKVDAYSAYHEQTKGLDLNDEEKKKSFELSFNIQGLKTEIPTNESEIAKLTPIELAKVQGKKELVKGLQKELDAIILKENVKKETSVGADTINKVIKNEEKKVEQTPLSDLAKRYGKVKKETDPVEEEPVKESNESDEVKWFVDRIKAGESMNTPESLQFYQNNKESIETELQNRKSERRKNAPKFGEQTEGGVFKFNQQKPLEKKEILHDYFDERPELNNEMDAFIEGGQNNLWQLNLGGTNQYVQFARTIIPDKYTGERKNFPGGEETVTDSDGREYSKFNEPVVVKIQSIKGDKGKREGKNIRVINVFNKQTGAYIASVKELEKGNTDYSEGEIKQLVALQSSQLKEKPVEKEIAPSKLIKQPVVKRPKLTPIDLETQERDLLQNRQLSNQEVNEELDKEMAREETFAETGQFQKNSDRKGEIEKVVERVKKSFPKVKVVYKPGANFAGRLIGNTIEINPDYAGIDTPIHEAGHIMIDAIGYNNKVVQVGIKQLKDTDLWEDVKSRYPELNEEQLGKEVLAEAIGMEGSLIFKTEAAKTKFQTVLDYIFTKLKQLLGIDRNVSKSLAKQIIGGIKTKSKTGNSKEEQFAKKKPFKTLDEMTEGDLAKKLTLSLEAYREKVLNRSMEQIRKDLQFIKEGLKSDKYTDEQKADLEGFKEEIDKEAKKDASKWFAYKEDVAMLSSILSEGRLEDMTDERLLEAYNLMTTGNFQDEAKDSKLGKVKEQIAYRMFVKRKAELSKYDKFIEEQANKTDISTKDILMKNLGHMTQNQPELQEFSKIFDDTHFDMIQERNKLKTELEAIGKDVIKEKNRSIGITDKAKEFVMSGSVKYFDFVEHPDGRYYTLEEAKSKNFTPAQTKFLKFMLNLNDLRNKQFEGMDEDQINTEVLKVDKGVMESFREDGILQAFSAYLGNGHNIQNVRINYKGKPTSYGEIEQDLVKQGNKGTIDKFKALMDMVKYQLAARRQLKTGTNIDEKDNPLALTGGSEYNLSTDGRLKSKFNKPRDKSRGYSKDFYKAAHSFIDDYTHTEHMGKILPYIQSIEYLNEMGFAEHEKKENVAEWVKQWIDLHIFKKEKVGPLGPELDSLLKLMRKLTSLSVMAFNIGAGGWNLAMGIYNNIRSETAAIQAKGLKRLFLGTNRDGYGAYNKKANEILKKYDVVSVDFDSNPKLEASKIFDTLAHGVTRAGEFTIQGSLFLGLMSDEDYNSFEIKDGKLELKEGVDEKALKERLIKNKNRISDIQGKYSERDRRNFQAGELGKAVGQFHLWAVDWITERFGERYIDANGKTKVGTWRPLFENGFAELRADIKKDGPKALWNNKEAMANLKGLMTVAVFISLGLGGDDDKKKRKAGDDIDKALGNLLFIFDPSTLKFTLEHPIASMSIVTRFIGAVEAGTKFNWDKAGKEIVNITPYNKAIKQGVDLLDSED